MPLSVLRAATFFSCMGLGLFGAYTVGRADEVTFEGTVTYEGPYHGATLYVGLINPQPKDDIVRFEFMKSEAYPIASTPFSQPYSLTFETDGPYFVILGALLDVDGGGPGSVSSSDIIGWYAGTQEATLVNWNTPRDGLDFALPRAEIHGRVTFASGQNTASVRVSGGHPIHPSIQLSSSGDYSMRGLYPGTWGITAFGNTPSGWSMICYGDPQCVNPTFITLTDAEVKTDIDLQFSDFAPSLGTSWGRLKSRY